MTTPLVKLGSLSMELQPYDANHYEHFVTYIFKAYHEVGLNFNLIVHWRGGGETEELDVDLGLRTPCCNSNYDSNNRPRPAISCAQCKRVVAEQFYLITPLLTWTGASFEEVGSLQDVEGGWSQEYSLDALSYVLVSSSIAVELTELLRQVLPSVERLKGTHAIEAGLPLEAKA